jgi:PTH2 family peptidyl-tRNA hydrolase
MIQFEYKQAIILRSDLKMSCGKAISQACHASISASYKTEKVHPDWLKEWMNEGQRKIILKVPSIEDFKSIDNKAKKFKISSIYISDKGLTELKSGTITTLGLGPAPSKLMNKVIGNLHLF